ncbi:MAG: stage III sporulation protein AF [Clostridia bacterium]|nr:stage III sporulation protein AF [Clostridia bacterium]
MNVSSYILSIVGVVLLGVLIDVIMPDGEMNKYIKGVFSLLALFIIVSPVQKLFNNNFDLNNIFYDSKAVETDSDFLDATNKQIKNQLERSLIVRYKNAGFENIKVEIKCDMSNNVSVIKKVIIDISNLVMSEDLSHINKYTEIKKVAMDFLNLEESDVEVNE